MFQNLLGRKIAGCSRRIPRWGRIGEIPQARLLDAGPQFDLRVPQHPPVDPGELAALGSGVDVQKLEEEWLVVCGCGLREGCAWTALAKHPALDLGVAVDRGLLRLSFYEHGHADCGDRHAHSPGVYHLAPQARLAGPRAFLEAALHPNAPNTSAIARDGVENAEARAEQSNAQCDPLHPVHAVLPQGDAASVTTGSLA